jgi:nucleoid-associated protein Lsr2
MASRTIVLLEDDVDGSKADETIEFGIDGTTYDIDLSDSNAKKLRDALDRYISKARKLSGKRSTSRKASSAVDLKAVRAWAAPTASSSPAADGCQPRYSSSTRAPATKPRQTKEPPRLLGGSLVSLLTCSSTGHCFVLGFEQWRLSSVVGRSSANETGTRDVAGAAGPAVTERSGGGAAAQSRGQLPQCV